MFAYARAEDEISTITWSALGKQNVHSKEVDG